jgi:hypothetical protein
MRSRCQRLGKGLEWAVEQARRIIHDNDVEGLKRLLEAYPALLSWSGNGFGESGGILGFATGSYGDSFAPFSEEHFTRAACAEVLIDAGTVVVPSVLEGLLASRARGLLQLFQRKGLLPQTLLVLAAVGDMNAVAAALEEQRNDQAAITEAFTFASSFERQDVASLLLDRAIALDPELGARIDANGGRAVFMKYFIDNRPGRAIEVGLWKAFVMEQVGRAVYSWSGPETSLKSSRGNNDLTTFVRLLEREPWLLGEAFVEFQTRLIERAALKGFGEFIAALLDMDPAILRRQPPPASQAIEFAFTYANTHVIPLITRIWPLPDDLPHATGMGDLSRVKRWFEDSGAAALGDVPLRRGGLPPRARREHQYPLELPRAGQHPARAGLASQLRRDAVPHRSRHRHDHQGPSLE